LETSFEGEPMAHILPKLQFLRERYITLNEGFDRVGRTMFPKEWTGLEALAWPEDEPQNLWDEKQKLQEKFDFHSQRARDIRLVSTYEMEKGEYALHRDQLEKLETERRDAREKLDQFGQTYDARISDAHLFDRRKKVENRLCNLMRKKELDVGMIHGSGFPIEQFFQSDRFHISFAYSYIITPGRHGRRRRVPAYFVKQEFNRWILPFERKLQQYDTSPIEERMLVWFRSYRDVRLENSERPKKEDALAECKFDFGPEDLPANFDKKFLAAWRLLAPDTWQKGGKPKKP
jgi:hypothetical protein